MRRITKRRRTIALRLLVVAAIAAIGLVLPQLEAASFAKSEEAETGNRSGNQAVCQDGAASASQAVRFGAGSCGTPSGRTYTNPVKQSTADPGAMAWNGKYYVVSTSGNPSFNISVSDDMVSWQWANAAVFNGTHPWGKDRFWAPELHRVNNKFYVYYSAGDNAGRMKIGVATADNVTGPYRDLGRPVVSDSGSDIIDINFFRDDDGRQYLFWKKDAAAQIVGQEVAADGITLVGSPRVVLQPSLGWEENSLEGSWLMKKNGLYYMYYSGSVFWSANYGVGVARASAPLGTWTKKADPILRSSARWKGPGHNSVLSIGGNDYMFYHAWDRTPNVGDRIGLVDRISWSGAWPSVANGTPTETPQPVPY